MKRKKNKDLICPCCKALVGRKHTTQVVKITKAGVPTELPPNARLATDAEIHQSLDAHDRWACDDCLNGGSAIPGTIARQRKVHPMYHSYHYLAYFDREIKACRDCGEPFSYAKEDQLFYYETLAKDRSAKAVRCIDCRRAINRHNKITRELGEMLENGELKRESDRETVIAHYHALGHPAKARYFEKRRPKK